MYGGECVLLGAFPGVFEDVLMGQVQWIDMSCGKGLGHLCEIGMVRDCGCGVCTLVCAGAADGLTCNTLCLRGHGRLGLLCYASMAGEGVFRSA